MSKNFINVHHSADFAVEGEKQFETVNIAHKNRWGGKTKSSLGYYGGYHYLVERDGEVKKFREESEIGAHNDKQGMNLKAIGICFAGNFSIQDMPAEQAKAGLELIKDIMRRNGVTDENIKAHRAYKSTQCWGMKQPVGGIVAFLESISVSKPAEPSPWAVESIERVKGLYGITEWQNPQQLINDSTAYHIFYKMGILEKPHQDESLSKEEMVHALDKFFQKHGIDSKIKK